MAPGVANSQPTRTDADPTRTVSWEVTPRTAWPLRLLAYGGVAVIGGLVLLVVGLVAHLVWRVADGDVLVALGVLGGLLALVLARSRHVVAISRSGLHRPAEDERNWRPSRRGTLAASLVGAPVLWAAMQVSWLAAVGVGVLGFGGSLVASVVSSEAELDGEDLRLVDGRREASLTDLVATSRLAVGPVVAYWLSYARGSAGPSAPRFVVVPRRNADAVDDVLAAAVDVEADADPMDRRERAIVLAFGVGMLLIGPLFWWLVPASADGGSLVVGYIAVFSVVFAIPVVWYGITG